MLNKKYKQAQEILTKGGIVVLPSDTIYGIFCSATNREAVRKLYAMRKRDTDKPCIILIESIQGLSDFSINISDQKHKELQELWSKKCEPTTIILESSSKKNTYLHRGKGSLAFRVPSTRTKRGRELKMLLKITGPLLAPSANTQGEDPATTVTQARKYFTTKVGLYISHGKKLEASPSKIYDYTKGSLKRIR